MSYIEEQSQTAHRVAYAGADNETVLVLPGGLGVRINAANISQYTNLTGAAGTFEHYAFVKWGGGAFEGFNGSAVSVPDGNTWVNLDANGMLQDGADFCEALITLTNDADVRSWRVNFWHPTPTKVCITGEMTSGILPPTTTADDVVIEMHRVTLGFVVGMQTFNGKNYRLADGWLPSVAADFLTISAGTYSSHGYSWKLQPNGMWLLFMDAVPAAGNQSHTVDVTFTRYNQSAIRTYGVFN
jgi:hypothetical protein